MDITDIKPNKAKALFLAKRELPTFVYDAVNLEGINFTLPEVQTLLDGVTIGGHKLADQTIALNQAAAWKFIFEAIENDTFALNKEFICQLHSIAAKEEALEWGKFRTGGVTIAGTDFLPPAADKLDQLWSDLVAKSQTILDIYDQAIFIFLIMARTQFFYDVNKRMGRFIMNAVLLSKGLPAINLPVKRQQEFNELMLAFYQSGDLVDMTKFMKSCLSEQVIKIMSEF